jgi:SAM-dependent methyltransferase
VARIACDLAGGSLQGWTVLDLACDEGNFTLQLGELDADASLGIEGRGEKLERANAQREARGLTNVRFEQEDVRRVTAETHGVFDLVLCLGILYHFDTPDVFRFAENLAGLTRRYAIIETQTSLSRRRTESDNGHEYWGLTYPEDIAMSGASLDNPESFWPTRASLFNLLQNVGFTSVAEVQVPAIPSVNALRDHVVLIAAKGKPQRFDPPDRTPWPERLPLGAHPAQGVRWRIIERIAQARGRGLGEFFSRSSR